MAGKQAKTLTDEQIADLLAYASTSRNPLRNRVLVLLSVQAGLKAGEIAKLSWSMVLAPCGATGSLIQLPAAGTGKKGGRCIPLHPDLREALEDWRRVSTPVGPVVRSERDGSMTPVSIVNWFALAYRAIGIDGTSHTGRRTFLTRAALVVHSVGGSLRDVQVLAGHRSILTTQRYSDNRASLLSKSSSSDR
ncbi:MAG: tyrosine-type recombinase/integrase [Pseudomonadota bacterium]